MALAFSSTAIHGGSLSERTKGALSFSCQGFEFGVFYNVFKGFRGLGFGFSWLKFCFVLFLIAASQMGCFPAWDGAHQRPTTAVSFSGRHSAVKPLKAEAKRNESAVTSAATIVAPGNNIQNGHSIMS